MTNTKSALESIVRVSSLPIQMVCLQVGSNLWLPLVPIAEQLLLVVQQLLMSFRGKLEVGTLQ